MMNRYLEIHPEVQRALENNLPVIALESTIISHGMPYPQNYETAIEVEQLVRDADVTPATIALLGGKIKIGLTTDEIKHLAKGGKKIVKASRRDLPYLLAHRIDGATTVAATMIGAELAGIKIFATGGIGGVHKGAAESFDVSADLQELATSNVAVICAGVKAILDLGATLEYLETHGVPVLGYKTEELPAFYARKSGFKVNYVVKSPSEIAEVLRTKWSLNLNGGVIIANPISKEKELDLEIMNKAIETALSAERKLNIKGKESTPFLLEKVKELTGGKSLEANIELVKSNVLVACEIAKSFHAI